MKWCVVLLVCVVDALCSHNNGGKAPRLLLNDGNSIPAVGLGTFLGFDENGQKEVLDREIEDPVTWALDAGYSRLVAARCVTDFERRKFDFRPMIDTASAYHNEEQVGRAIVRSSVHREDVFLVTKLGSNEQRDVVGALRGSLSRLNLTYVDLYLIHNPVAFTPDHSSFDIIDYIDTWRGMEQAQTLGLARSIGISNFNISQMDRLLANCKVRPAVLQVEVNLNLAQDKILNYCKTHNIVVMAYTPFGSLFSQEMAAPAPRVNDTKLMEIAEKYKKTVPQVVLRYLVQRGVVPIPKSVKKERIEDNINIFDFELTLDEMNELGKFNKDFRIVHPSFWQDHPYYPFERKEVTDRDPFAPKNKNKK